MLCLINTNRMNPPIGPIGLDYIASAARKAGIRTEVLDLCLAQDPDGEIDRFFARQAASLVGITFRNVDDCFWPGGGWFVADLVALTRKLQKITDAPIVLGGVGFSVVPAEILEQTGVEFGIHGDGEQALVALHREIVGSRRFEKVPGLLWRRDSQLLRNPPSWESPILLESDRDAVDNAEYFRRGGQGGVETKRGCGRPCVYCADPLAKGRASRLRPPEKVADEIEALLSQGIDVLHLCDSEFNLPPKHAMEVCEEIIRRGLPRRVRWYAYLTIRPFSADLARQLRAAGCVGINFGTDSASDAVLKIYRQGHTRADIESAIRLCRENGIRVMIDLLIGGPGENPETVSETISFLKEAGPDCVGAALGVRLYPGAALIGMVASEHPLDGHPGIRRQYEGPVDLLKPTFYIAPSLGERPAEFVRDLIGNDERFFAPRSDATLEAESAGRSGATASEVIANASRSGATDRAAPAARQADSSHNYNDNTRLVEAIRSGARGAYWDILRQYRDARP